MEKMYARSRKQNLFFSLITVILIFANTNLAAQGPGVQWQYSRCISLSTPTTMANYQVKLVLTNNEYTNMKSDGSDLRFYDASNNNCPYWIEHWDLNGISIVWIKIPVNNTAALTMYYGNAGATAASNGGTTFDWFDEFNGSSIDATKWQVITDGGSVTVAGGNVTLSRTQAGSVYLNTKDPGFSTASTSFYLESKFNVPDKFHRNRFYATTSSGASSPLGFDYGYFRNNGNNGNQVFFNDDGDGWTPQDFVAINTNYISQWALNDNNVANNYTWNTLDYPGYNSVANHTTQYNNNIRHLTIGVTEQSITSTKVDWVRVRKRQGSEPVLTTGPQQPLTLTASASNICLGTPVTFTASTNGYTTFQFYRNGIAYGAPTSLNAVTIPNLVNGDKVKVTSLACGNTVASNEITMVVNPIPTASLSADKTAICAGESILLTASTLGNPVNTTYNFRVEGSIVQSGTSNTYTTNSITNGQKVSVIAITPTGCSDTSADLSIVVNSLPTGTLVSSDPDNKICQGASITFTATPGMTSYEFFVDGVSQGPASATNTFTTSTLLTGLRSVGVRATNSNNCSADFSPIAITVYALPSGTLSVVENSGIPNNDTICAGSNVTFTAPAGHSNYKFYLNGTGAILNGNPGLNSYTTSSLTNGDFVSVEITNNNSCTTTLNSVPITVNPLPAGTLTSSDPDNMICDGQSVTFTATGASTYRFYVNGLLVQSGISAIYSYIPAMGDVISVQAISASGCAQTYTPITITVNPLPSGTFSYTENSGKFPDDGIICKGESISFEAPSEYANYEFKVNGTTDQNGSGNAYTTTTLPAGNVTVSVIISTTAGCTLMLNVPVTVNSLPVVADIAGLPTLCANGTTQLSDATTGGLWSSSNTAAATVDLNSGLVTGVAAGNTIITYTVTNNNGCSDAKSLNVTVYGLPAPGAIGGNKSVCAGGIRTLTNNLTGGTWSSNNSLIAPIASDGTVTGIAAGTVTITYTVTNGNGCTVAVTTPFEVYALPFVDPVSGPAAVCKFATITLTNGTSGGTWQSGNTSIATVHPATGVVTGIAPGLADINYTVTNGNGCTTTVTKQITVHALPNINLTGPNPICPNSTGTYTTESGMNDYVWTFSGGIVIGGGTSIDNFATVDWNQPGTKSIYVNYTDGNGCQAEKQVTVNTTAVNQPVITGLNDICQDGSTTYSTAAGNTAYTWAVVGGNITSGGTATDPTATIQWTNPGSQSVTVNYTNTDGCRATSPTAYNVTVHPLPLAGVSASATAVCQNSGDVTITFTGSNGSAPYTFQYRVDGGAIQIISTTSGNSIGITISSAFVTTHLIQLVNVTDSHGCQKSESGSVSVLINPLPSASIIGTTAVCEGTTAPNITFTGSAGTAPYTFEYNINGGANQTVSTVAGNSITMSAPTGTAGIFNYNLVGVADDNGCSQNQTQTATITVNPLPIASITVNTSQVCKGGAAPMVTFTGNNGTGPYTFTYKINGGADQTASGNPTATVNVGTGTAGVFTYTLVSVKDASSTSCSQLQTGNISVQVDPTSVGGTLSGNATVCYGINSGNINLSGHIGNVIRWESSTDGGSTWNTISNTSTTLTYTNLTQTTIYRSVLQSGLCSTDYSGTVTITVNATSTGGTISGSTIVCSGTNSGTLTLSGNVGSVVRWEYSTDGGSTWTNITNITSSQTYSNLTQTRQYRAWVLNSPCTGVHSATATIAVNPLPDATISGATAVCQDAPAPTIGLTGINASSPYTFTYSINGVLQPTIQGSPTTNVNASTTIPGTYTYNITKVEASAGCSKNLSGVSAIVTVNPKPSVVNITPGASTICQGTITSLISSIITPGSKSGSLTVNTAIPNGSFLNKKITISGIPAGSIITGIDVKLNIDHNRTKDLRIFLEAPNGEILKLVNLKGNNADFTNTTISSNSSTPLTNGGNPFTGTYAADRNNGQIATTQVWGNLYSIANGDWELRSRDYVSGTSGNLINWSITINYQTPSSPPNVVWSPLTDLYTDPGGNIPYTGTPVSTVYVKPSSSGNKTYTATSTNGFGCSVSSSTLIKVNPTPVVNIQADYCIAPGKVRLTSTATPTGAFLWSTDQTSTSIDVDIADDYSLTVTTGQGCVGSSLISVARELVENGDFEAGNDGSFTSGYLYIPDGAGNGELVPDNDNRGYSITTNGNNVHNNFWGVDHTTGSGNFMAINGHDNISVWEQTVDVLPNTEYYFAAWARSLNNAGPFAKLIFTVNGVEIGNQLNLTGRPNDNDPAHDNWKRFYGNWKSGSSTTSVVLGIKNKEPNHEGNDFAIDDISFASLSTFISLNTLPETGDQEVCKDKPIEQIIYSVGNGTPSAPNITGLPAGVSAVWDQDRMIINGTPSAAGNYTYTISTTGSCNPKTMSGTLTVTEQKVALSNGLANNSLCINTSLPAIKYHLSGKATGATVSGLPAGVSYTQTGNDITISGTPNVSGTFNYTITTTGGSCTADSKSGVIEVTTQTITESSENKDQSLCINTPVDNIIFTIAGTANNASIMGLPVGLSLTKNGQQYIISGTPTQSGTFNYTVTTSGTCSVTASIGGTLTIAPAAIAGTLNNATGSCTGAGTINLSGQIGTVQKWQKSIDNGVIWTDIANTTSSENYTGITTPVLYRVFVDNGCGEVVSNNISVGRHNYWTGTQNSNWNNTGNWSDNLLPTTSCPDVYIPSAALNQPVISSGSVLVNNLILESGALLSITNDAVLQIAGGFSAPGLARIESSDGTLEMVGSAAQQIPANLFVNNHLKDLKLSNNSGVSINGNVDIYHSLAFNSVSASLNTGDYLTLKSNKQNTAWIGPLTGSQSINGAVTVERYINTGTLTDQHTKGWQLVAFPTSGQTIKNSLQEGAATTSQNPKPGYGVQITSPGNWSANGFDALSVSPSMKVYNSDNDNYDGIPNTNGTDIHNDHGYFLFVRGDRSVTGISDPPTNVTLRSKGILFTPANLGAGGFSMTVKPNKMESVGNPYASAVDIRQFGFNNISSEITMWDATDPSRGVYQLGIFHTLSFDGTNYSATPGGGAFAGNQNFIQSGQAFFVQSNSATAGSLTINEDAKVGGSTILMRPSAPKGSLMKIRSNLYLLQNGNPVLMDGTLSFLDSQYSDEIDIHDARKMMNSGENFGIQAKGSLLIVERRSVPKSTDTIFYNMSRMRKQTYRLQFINDNLSRGGIEAWLEDTYTKKKTILASDGTTEIEFDVNNSTASYVPDRFRIVFAEVAAAPVPVTFIKVQALYEGGQVHVKWIVENETNVSKYVVMKSTDGTNFTDIEDVVATGLKDYAAIDQDAVAGYNYYRIRSVDRDGRVAYSEIVKVWVGSMQPLISVFPNPITHGIIHLRLENMPKGKYLVRLMNPGGQVMLTRMFDHTGGNYTEKIPWDYKMAHGNYKLEVQQPDGGIRIITVMY